MNTRTHAELANFIWGICNLLRGPYKRNEYRKVILPLTVLRRFDCVLASTKKVVLAANEASKGKDESVRHALLTRAANRSFYNTSRLDFGRLLDDPNHLAQNLQRYIREFSPNVREIMDRFAFTEQIMRMAEKNLLYEVVKEFAGVELSDDRIDNRQMGYLFEELIRIGSEASNEEAEAHFTPREVIRLMVNLLLSPEGDLSKSHIVKTIYDPACGTGGMLSTAEEYIRTLNDTAKPQLYGQDYNDEAWAVCRSDMLIKDEDATNIRDKDILTDDQFDRRPDGSKWTFDYMLANPPFGVEWKQEASAVKREARTLGYDGRFGAGLPRIDNGSLLFLQHMLAKMRPPQEGGSRLAILFNGSPLFNGDAGGGESEIRRWIVEQDWLEAIVALPGELFYRTTSGTYIWILTNRKEPHRRGKVQLIDGRQFYVKMRKSLGNKRNKIGDPRDDPREPDHIGDLTRIHGEFKDGLARPVVDEDPVTHEPRTRERAVSKVFDNEDFGYRKITVERPLKLNFAANEERTARLEDETAFRNLATSKKRPGTAHDEEVEAGQVRQEDIRALLSFLQLVTLPVTVTPEPARVDTEAYVRSVVPASDAPAVFGLASQVLHVEPRDAKHPPFSIARIGRRAYGVDEAGAVFLAPAHEAIDADIACWLEMTCSRGEAGDDWYVADVTEEAVAALRGAAAAVTGGVFRSRAAFLAALEAAEEVAGLSLSAPERRAVLSALSERDPDAEACRDRHGDPEPDPELRDTETVPLKEDVDAYFAREVLPHVPDAWIDESNTKVGYEIPFNRHFYIYEPPRPLGEIEADLLALEREIVGLLSDVTGSTAGQPQ